MVTTTSTSPPERSELLRRLFKSYYETAKLELPDDMELREFAVQPFDSESYIRHLAFNSEAELRQFLLEKVPLQVYFSAGKYQTPSAKDMELMGWMGSDLMFDLDAEEFCEVKERFFCPVGGEELESKTCKTHNAEAITYSEVRLDCLKSVLRRAQDLVGILRDDFGLEGSIIFSGNRGFHVNVDCYGDCALLDSEDRKQIVEYLTDPKVEAGSPDDPGWPGRLAKGVEPLKLDAQVTIDVHRLRRIPGSLNGKSGLPVMRVSSETDLEGLLSKSPFKGKGVVKPLVSGDVIIYDREVRLEKDVEKVLDGPVAVYLALKGLGRLKAYVK